MIAIWTASRPTTASAASMCSHSGVVVCGVASVVLLGMGESAGPGLELESQHLRVGEIGVKDGRITICPSQRAARSRVMTATVVHRPPLGLPPGSIRGLLAIQITAIFWMFLLTPSETVRIPLNLYFLLALVLVFFVAHGKSIARRDEPTASPLWLPGGTLRFLVLAGTAAILVYVAVSHPE